MTAPHVRGAAAPRAVRLGAARSISALSLALYAASAALAQGAPPLAPAAAASVPAPAPIALPELVVEADSAARFAQRTETALAPSPELAQIEAQLGARAPELAQRAAALHALLAQPGMSLDALSQETRDWSVLRDELARWQRAATDQLVALERSLDELEARADVWELTRDAALHSQAPAEVLARIDGVRAELRRARADARAARHDLLALQTRIADQQSAVAQTLDRIGAARASAETSLLAPDSPVLWRAFEDSSQLWQRCAAQLASDARLAREYAQQPDRGWVAHALAFLFVAWLCLRARGSRARLRADAELAHSAVIFERPLASAALVALALTPLFHAHAPARVLALSRIALIAPALRLLPALAPRALYGAIAVAALLALSGEVRGVLAAAPALERCLFAGELALAAGTLAWLMRPARLALMRDAPRVPRLLGTALRSAALALLAALAADVLGWSNLAHLLGNGTLRSAYAALVVYASGRVLRAGVRAAATSENASRLRLVRDHGEAALALGARLVNAVALALWAGLTLLAFGLWDGAARAARAGWNFELAYGSLAVSLGDVLVFALTIGAAVLIARLVRFVLEGDLLARWQTQRGIGNAVARTGQYLVLLLGFFAAAAAAGIDMNRFAVLAGALGVGIGFGLQNIVNNFVSGLILLYERPIQVGDAIEVSGVFGNVARIGVRSSTLRTWEGAEVIVPNATLIAERVSNWTLSDHTRRVDVRVGVAYGADPHRVLELLLRVAREHPAVLAQPEPSALFSSFGDSALEFELRFWTQLERFMAVKSEIGLAIHDSLGAEGVAIPFPQRDLHLRSVAPEAARALRGSSREP